MVDITNLANMFSQKTGAQSSMATSVMSAVMGFMAQKGLGNTASSAGSNSGGIMSAISSVLGGGGSNNLNQDHELVQHVQQNCGIQDPQQATQYTQHAVSVINEHGNSNPQGLQSLLSNLTGGGGGQSQPQQGGEQQEQQQPNQNKKKGLLGDVMSGLGV